MSKLLKSAMIAAALMAAPTTASAVAPSCSTGTWTMGGGGWVVPCTFADFWSTIGTMSATAISAYIGPVGGSFTSIAPTTAVSETWGGVLSFDNPMASFLGSKTVVTISTSPTFSVNTSTSVINATQAVPGPIAGAGLPLLAVGAAFVAWRRRRAVTAA